MISVTHLAPSSRQGHWWKFWRDGCKHANASNVGHLTQSSEYRGALNSEFRCPDCGLHIRTTETCQL